MEMGQLVEEALRKELMRSLDERRNKISNFEVKEQEQSKEKIQRLQRPYQQDKNTENVNVNPGVVSSRAGSATSPQQTQPSQSQSQNEELNKIELREPTENEELERVEQYHELNKLISNGWDYCKNLPRGSKVDGKMIDYMKKIITNIEDPEDRRYVITGIMKRIPGLISNDQIEYLIRYRKAQSAQKGSLEYSIVLSGLKFPMTKNEIIERAKKVKYPEDDQETQETKKITIDILNQLPDNIYTSKNKLEKDCSNILMRKLKNLRGYEGRIITIVYDEQLPPKQEQKTAGGNALLPS
jgi:hypothetical protein